MQNAALCSANRPAFSSREKERGALCVAVAGGCSIFTLAHTPDAVIK